MEEAYGKSSMMLSKCGANTEISEELTGYDPRNRDMPFEIPILQRHNKPRHEAMDKRKRHFSESHNCHVRKTVNILKVDNKTDKTKCSSSAMVDEQGHLNADRKRKHGDNISLESSSKKSFEMALSCTIPSHPKQRKSSNQEECHDKILNSVSMRRKSSSDTCNVDSNKQPVRNKEKSFGMTLNKPSETKHRKPSSEKQCQGHDKEKSKTDLRMKRCTVDIVPLKTSHKHHNKDLLKGDENRKGKNLQIESNKYCHSRNKHCPSKLAHMDREKSKLDCGKNERTLDRRMLSESNRQVTSNEKNKNLVVDEIVRHQCTKTVSGNSGKHHNSSHQKQLKPAKDKYHCIKALSNNDEKCVKTGVNRDKGDSSNICKIKEAKPAIVADKCVNNDKLLKILKDFNLMDKLPIESQCDHDVQMENKIIAKEQSASVGNNVIPDKKVSAVCLGKHRSNSVDGCESQMKKMKPSDCSLVSTANIESKEMSSKNDVKASDKLKNKYLEVKKYWQFNIGQKKAHHDPIDKNSASTKDQGDKKPSSKCESVHKSEMRNDGSKKGEMKKGDVNANSSGKRVSGKELSKFTYDKGESSKKNCSDNKKSGDCGKKEISLCKRDIKNNCNKSASSMELCKSNATKDASIKSDTNGRQLKEMSKRAEPFKECRKKTLSSNDDVYKTSRLEIKIKDGTNKTVRKNDDLSLNEQKTKKAKTEAPVINSKSELKKNMSEKGNVFKGSGSKKTIDINKQNEDLGSIEQNKKRTKTETAVVKESSKSTLKNDALGKGDFGKSDINKHKDVLK